MNKKIAISCVIASIGAWLILTILGKQIEPHVSVTRACIVPFGASAWEYAMESQVQASMSRSEVEDRLGPAVATMPSMSISGGVDGVVQRFQNPHDAKRSLVVWFDKDDRVLSVSSITYTCSANGKNMRQVLEDLGVKTIDTDTGYQIKE